jgi:hypothetical protein
VQKRREHAAAHITAVASPALPTAVVMDSSTPPRAAHAEGDRRSFVCTAVNSKR